MRILHHALVAALCLTTVGAQHVTPPVFQQLDFDHALRQAKADGKLLVLDCMTSWCGPCKVMDKTTWVDPKLVAWLEQHTIAVQLDMDHHEALKKQLGLRAYPTVYVFKDGEKADQVVGLRKAPFIIDWLTGIQKGETNRERLLTNYAAVKNGEDAKTDIERLDILQELVGQGCDREAVEESLFLWERLNQPRSKQQLHSAMTRLSQRDQFAKTAFGQLRTPLDAKVHAGSADAADLRTWFALNRMLDEESRTMTWCDEQAKTEAGRTTLKRHASVLFSRLITHGHWVAAGHSLKDAIARVSFLAENLDAYDRPRAAGAAIPATPMIRPRVKASNPVDANSIVTPRAARPTKAIPAIPMVTAPDSPGARESQPEKKKTPAKAAAGVPAKRIMLPRIPATKRIRQVPGIPMGQPSAAPATHSIRASLELRMRQLAGECYAALLAAGRLDEASAVATYLLKKDDTAASRTNLVSRAMAAGQLERARAKHQKWLDEASR
jgi:thioredoxin-like negative regulator of GroEL